MSLTERSLTDRAQPNLAAEIVVVVNLHHQYATHFQASGSSLSGMRIKRFASLQRSQVLD